MSMIKGLHHVHLKCKKEQFEDVLKFYTDILELTLLGKHEDCAILDTGNGIFEIFCDAEKLLGQGDFRHVAFYVDSTAECIEKVEKAGYRIIEHPVKVMFDLGQPTPAVIGFCEGPIGEEIEFFQIRKEETKS